MSIFKRSKWIVGAGAAVLSFANVSAYAAICEYSLDSQWNSGFVAKIKITNDTGTTIDGWTVNWSLPSDNGIDHSWSANVSGSNPYTASNLSWNQTIRPGSSVEFGFTGRKGSADAVIAELTGDVCSSATTPTPVATPTPTPVATPTPTPVATPTPTPVATPTPTPVATPTPTPVATPTPTPVATPTPTPVATPTPTPVATPTPTPVATPTPTPVATPTPTSSDVTYAINVGSNQEVYVNDNLQYTADAYFDGGKLADTNTNINASYANTVYQTERWGAFSYNLPVINGTYSVTLQFAEFYWDGAGKRVLNVDVENTREISGLDIFAEVGANTALDHNIDSVSVTDGVLNLEFTAGTDAAKLSGIIVRALDDNGGIAPTPVVTPTPVATPTPTSCSNANTYTCSNTYSYTCSNANAYSCSNAYSYTCSNANAYSCSDASANSK